MLRTTELGLVSASLTDKQICKCHFFYIISIYLVLLRINAIVKFKNSEYYINKQVHVTNTIKIELLQLILPITLKTYELKSRLLHDFPTKLSRVSFSF